MTCIEKSDLIWLSTKNITEFWKAFHNQLHFSVIWKSVCAVCKGIERLRYLHVDWKTIFLQYSNICSCFLYSLLLPKLFLASLTEKTIVKYCFELLLPCAWLSLKVSARKQTCLKEYHSERSCILFIHEVGVSVWIIPASQPVRFLEYICFNIFVQLTIWNNKTNQLLFWSCLVKHK